MKSLRAAAILLSLSIIFFSCERSTDMVDDPGIAPAAPIGLRVYYANDGEIIIEWRFNPEPDVKGYNIYRRTEHTESILTGFVSSDYFVDDSLEYDTTYYYKITAVNLWDRESEFSNEISATPVNKYNPLTPYGLEINARNWEGNISVYLNWLGSDETDIAGFNVYRSEIPGFTPDTGTFIGFTTRADFADTSDLDFYTDYYYRIKAEDKGGLLSDASDEVRDIIYEIPSVIFPEDQSTVGFFREFLINAIDVPATYRIGLQTNKFFGEIWSTSISSSVTNDTLRIGFNPPLLQINKVYYWRIATYSGNSSSPNSISPVYTITFRD